MTMPKPIRPVIIATLCFWLIAAGRLRDAIGKEDAVIPPSLVKATVSTEMPRQPVKEVPPPAKEKLLPAKEAPRSHLSASARLLYAVVAPDLVYREGVLTEDTRWQGEVLVEGPLTVAPQTTLTIDAGTVVRLRRSQDPGAQEPMFLVQGRLVVKGTPESPVLFTSTADQAVAGSWQGIVLLGTEKRNSMEHCRIEGASVGLEGSFSNLALKGVQAARCRTGFSFRDAIVAMEGGGALECELGLEAVNSELDIQDAVFSGNRHGGRVAGSSLYLEGCWFRRNGSDGLSVQDGKVKIAGGGFVENTRGMALANCEGGVTGCRISDNREQGLVLENARLRVSGNEINRNSGIGVLLADGKAVLWGNGIAANGLYDLINTGAEEVRAMGNWWGVASAEVEKRVHDRLDDPKTGKVFSSPVLRARPEFRGAAPIVK